MISNILTDIDVNYGFSCVFRVPHAYYEVYRVQPTSLCAFCLNYVICLVHVFK